MSNEILVAIGYFGLGLSFTLISLMAIVFFLGKKYISKAVIMRPDGATTATTEKAPDQSVMRRLNEAAELTKQQNELAAASSLPSANALHSRHKNLMAARYKQLEDQKIAVLQSIVRDGFDPMVTVFNAATNQNEEVLLSHFLNHASGAPKAQQTAPGATPPAVVPADSIRKVERNGKTFFVIDGGKSNSGKKPTEH